MRDLDADLDFEAPRLARSLETLSPDAIDRLPFGVIRLDADGIATLYSSQERRLSGYRKPVVGRRFFSEVAPCMNNPLVSGRIEQAQATGRLDVIFDYVTALPSGERDVLVQVRIQSASDGGTWICIRRED
jgi:photoactive yellow protein